MNTVMNLSALIGKLGLNPMKRITRALLALWLITFAVLGNALEEITYIHTDHLGSPVLATAQNGSVKWREDYQPFGTPMLNQDGDNSVGFTGHKDDKGLGITYMQGRWYHQEIGRFVAIDPVGFVEGNPASFNRYGYGNNNPYKFVDPDGRNATIAFGGLLVESYNLAAGGDFNGAQVLGALGDGYDGEGSGVFLSAGEDVLNFGTGLLGLGAKAYRFYQAGKVTKGVAKAGASFLEGGQGFSSFAKLKSALGPAGEGKHWHHIVEQSQVGKFGAEAIQNTKNMAAVPADIHAKISGYYSSKQPFTNGATVRQWLRDQSFNEQYQFGLDVMKRFGAQ